MRHLNIIGPQVRRLRSGKEWSQNDFAIRLQILGMEHATRCKVSKIESRLVWVSDDDLMFLSRALGVTTEELYPDFIRGAGRTGKGKLFDAITSSKASRFGSLVIGTLSGSLLGAGALHFISSVASV